MEVAVRVAWHTLGRARLNQRPKPLSCGLVQHRGGGRTVPGSWSRRPAIPIAEVVACVPRHDLRTSPHSATRARPLPAGERRRAGPRMRPEVRGRVHHDGAAADARTRPAEAEHLHGPFEPLARAPRTARDRRRRGRRVPRRDPPTAPSRRFNRTSSSQRCFRFASVLKSRKPRFTGFFSLYTKRSVRNTTEMCV